MKRDSQLTTTNDPRKITLAGYLAEGKSFSECERIMGVSRQSLAKWAMQPAVQKLISEHNKRLEFQVKQRLKSKAYSALRVVEKGFKGAASKDAVDAAVKYLDRAGYGPTKTVDMNASVRAVTDKDESELLAEVEQLEQEVNEGVIDAD